ncbi:MAG TPA: hypothetical protein VFQ68_36835 [Streptosporangiaceae bacterium]|nr:hypothetical protein [Streptosporangiaceae bacterium]
MITRERRACPRRYLMCPPEHFAATYAINPWMAPDQPADRATCDAAVGPAQRGFVPVGVDMSELLKGGGGATCCTLELRS